MPGKPSGPKHSTLFGAPPPSQSAVAKALVGSAAIMAQTSNLLSIALLQSSPNIKGLVGVAGSSEVPGKPSDPKHSTLFGTPPPSQSAVAKALVGFANNSAQISILLSIALWQSSAGSSGFSPV